MRFTCIAQCTAWASKAQPISRDLASHPAAKSLLIVGVPCAALVSVISACCSTRPQPSPTLGRAFQHNVRIVHDRGASCLIHATDVLLCMDHWQRMGRCNASSRCCVRCAYHMPLLPRLLAMAASTQGGNIAATVFIPHHPRPHRSILACALLLLASAHAYYLPGMVATSHLHKTHTVLAQAHTHKSIDTAKSCKVGGSATYPDDIHTNLHSRGQLADVFRGRASI